MKEENTAEMAYNVIKSDPASKHNTIPNYAVIINV
jgi:hypothetical protein